jgi:hypothetical protein
MLELTNETQTRDVDLVVNGPALRKLRGNLALVGQPAGLVAFGDEILDGDGSWFSKLQPNGFL